ncbi:MULTISPECIES: hypothetical protein [Gluconobacter]|uniref:hypothetical protein n=1 Tax=Gluconobacter TaxID=441 RepID=UPI0039E8EF71
MKQATRDTLEKFLQPRMSTQNAAEIRDAIETCTSARESEGKDSPEVALRTTALLGLLEDDLTPDEYERAKEIVLGDQSIAQDAAVRVGLEMRSWRRAVEELRPLIGNDALNYKTPAGLYCAGLRMMGLAVDEAPLDAARAMFRQVRRQQNFKALGMDRAPMPLSDIDEDSPLHGASPRQRS